MEYEDDNYRTYPVRNVDVDEEGYYDRPVVPDPSREVDAEDARNYEVRPEWERGSVAHDAGYTVGKLRVQTGFLPDTSWMMRAQPARRDVGGLGFGVMGPDNTRAKHVAWAEQPMPRVVSLTNASTVYHSEATALAARITDAKVRIMNNYHRPSDGFGVGGSNGVVDAYKAPSTASLYSFSYRNGVGRVGKYVSNDE